MDIFFNILQALFNEIIGFGNSATFSVIKFIIGIYVVVLAVNIVLMLFQRGLVSDYKEALWGMNVPKEMIRSKDGVRPRWTAIKKRLESGKEGEYKVAIIEADNLVYDLIRKFGYAGENMSEILDKIPHGQIENLEDLKKSHEVRNRIIHDESFQLDEQAARETLAAYEDFLVHFQMLD